MTTINIGINEQDRLNVAGQLKRLLADTYTLYLQTHNFHWNVTGKQFRDLHLMFEEHYTELAQAVDDIAERIRTLGSAAPGTYKAFAELSSIKAFLDLLKEDSISKEEFRELIPELSENANNASSLLFNLLNWS